MLFEIVKNGKTLAQTEDVRCIDPIDTLKMMKKSGYKFRLDGDYVSIPQIKKYISYGEIF